MKRYFAVTIALVTFLLLITGHASYAAITGNFTITSYMGEQTLPSQTGTITLQGDLYRMDMVMPNFMDPKVKDTTTVIIDKNKRVFYMLFNKTKKGFRIKTDSKDGKEFLGKYSDKLKISSLEDLKASMPEGSKFSDLGRRKVNGMACTGYKVVNPEVKTEIWVSNEYQIPIKITTLGAGKSIYNLPKIDKILDKPASFFAAPKGFKLKDGFDLDFMAEAMGIQIPKSK